MKTPLMPTPRVFRETLPGIDSLRQDVDLWLNSLGRSWIPALDVYEKDGEMVFRLDLPGLEKSDVKVAVKDGVPAKLKVTSRISTTITDEIESTVDDPNQPTLL